MRALRRVLTLVLISACWPRNSVAQIYSAAARSASSPRVPSVSVPNLSAALLPGSPLSSMTSPLPLLSLPSPSPLSAPAAMTPQSVLRIAAEPALPKAASPSRSVLENAAVARALAVSIKDIPLSAAPQAAAESFALLTHEALAPRSPSADSLALPAPSVSEPPRLAPPSAPAPKPDPSVRRLMIGTAVMKSGMESVTLGMPLLALSAFGGFSAVAGLVVAYGLAQTVFAGLSDGLARRFQARKVLAGAVAAQAALVAVLVGVVAAGALSAATMIPLYLLIGGLTGIIETTRHSIPPLLVGKNEDALESYNAKLHIWYQVAGVAGALSAGALIGFGGPLWALAIQPPAYALAAWLFWRVRHASPAAGAPALAKGASSTIAGYFRDLKAGAKLVLGDVRLRWVAMAFILPQIVHRVFENLLIPVVAKKVLEDPSASGWLLASSNLGELVGAYVLLKLASRFQGPSAWIKWSAIGLTLIWALALSKSLFVLLPLILLSSATWSAGDLSLRSEVQGRVSDKDQARATAFLYGAFVLGSAAISMGLGFLLDALPLLHAISIACAAFTALALGVYYASRRLK